MFYILTIHVTFNFSTKITIICTYNYQSLFLNQLMLFYILIHILCRKKETHKLIKNKYSYMIFILILNKVLNNKINPRQVNENIRNTIISNNFRQYKMETYIELLNEFQSQQSSIKNPPKQQFNDLLDYIKNQLHKKQDKLNSKRRLYIKLLNKVNANPKQEYSLQDQSIQQSNSQLIMKQLEHEQLKAQLDQLSYSIRQTKQQRQIISDQIRIIEEKDQSIKNTYLACRKDADEAVVKVQNIKKYNKKLEEKHAQDLQIMHDKRNKIKAQLQQIKINMQYELQFQQKQKQIVSMKDNKIIIQKKSTLQPIYTKMELENSLRSFYMIKQLEEKWMNRQSISIHEIQKIEKNLNPKQKIRLMSKIDINYWYENKGLTLNQQLIKDICKFYQVLSTSFDRTERINFQQTQNLANLRKTQEQLNEFLHILEQGKAKDAIKIFSQNEQSLNTVQTKVFQNCKLIFQFNILFYSLLKKIISVTNTFQKLLQRRKNKLSTMDNASYINLKQYQDLLERSPEDVLLKWYCCVDNNDIEGYKYLSFVMKNDLLRVLATPQLYQKQKSALQNYEIAYQKAHQYEQKLLISLNRVLKLLLKNIIEGSKKVQTKVQKILKLKNMPIKNVSDQATRFCVESKQYFRRDNYKLLQKLERIELKKKGIYQAPQFQLSNLERQLNIRQSQKKRNFTKIGTNIVGNSSMRNFYQQKKGIKHTNCLSEKRTRIGSQQKNIRSILGQISNIAINNHKYRVKKQRNTCLISSSSKFI